MKRKLLSSMLAAAVVVTTAFSTTSVSEAEEPDGSNGKVEVTMKDNSVTIGNDAIERTFSTADSKLSITEIGTREQMVERLTLRRKKVVRIYCQDDKKKKKNPISLEPIDEKDGQQRRTVIRNASGDSDGPASISFRRRRSIVFRTVIMEEQPKATRMYPHNVVIKFDDSETFQSFSYTPRKESETTNGNIKGYKLYASTEAEKLDFESEEWGEPVARRRI